MSILRSVGFNYLIYSNNLFSPEDLERCRRHLYLLMDENAFNEENLRELFGILSDAFSEPKELSVTVHTSPEQVRAWGREVRLSNMIPELSQAPLSYLSLDGR